MDIKQYNLGHMSMLDVFSRNIWEKSNAKLKYYTRGKSYLDSHSVLPSCHSNSTRKMLNG